MVLGAGGGGKGKIEEGEGEIPSRINAGEGKMEEGEGEKGGRGGLSVEVWQVWPPRLHAQDHSPVLCACALGRRLGLPRAPTTQLQLART